MRPRTVLSSAAGTGPSGRTGTSSGDDDARARERERERGGNNQPDKQPKHRPARRVQPMRQPVRTCAPQPRPRSSFLDGVETGGVFPAGFSF
jgi:hypothetical protein